MTLSLADRLPLRPALRAGAGSLSPTTLVLVGSLLTLALSWPGIASVWHSGSYADTDDAMRMVQVRAWLAGQGWFDLTAHRLNPPQGVAMHWSRIVDVPLAVLIRGFELFTAQDRAELLARLVFPMLCQVALIAATVFTGCVLGGSAGALPAMLLAVTSCMQFGQFVPGRIDHHAPQITLLMLMTGFTADAILRAKPSSGAAVAVVIALSLGISLENLPFIAVVVAAMSLTWVVRGESQAPVLKAFGLGLATSVVVVFAATVAPSRYAVVSTDALSLPHVLAAVFGGLLLAGLAGWAAASPRRRAVSIALAGAALAVALVAVCPGVVQSPYAQLDPVVRAVWLSRVTEAMPLTTAVRLHPQAGTLLVAPLLAGLIAMLVAAFLETGTRRGVWIFISALTTVGLLGAMWEVRVISSATPLGLLGGVWAFVRMSRPRVDRAPALIDGLRASLLLLLFVPMAWVVVPVPDENANTLKSTADAEACRQADRLSPLAALGSKTIFAPIDSGAHLLVHTAMSVIGAPYHRNNHGNRAIIDGFSTDGVAAEAIVKATGAGYVALCPGQVQAEALTARNPDGLAAQLLAGNPPAWLERVAVAGTPYLVYAVK